MVFALKKACLEVSTAEITFPVSVEVTCIFPASLVPDEAQSRIDSAILEVLVINRTYLHHNIQLLPFLHAKPTLYPHLRSCMPRITKNTEAMQHFLLI